MTDLPTLAASVRLTGDLRADMITFLDRHRCAHTAEHCLSVAVEAGRLATLFDADQRAAESAGWLHDISAIIPNSDRVDTALQWGIDVLDEEMAAPMILHQKLSAVIAQRVFQICDRAVLEAITCHTTLRAGASVLDKVVFLADKIAWDQAGKPPYLASILDAIEHRSLDRAVWVYLDHLWQQRQTLAVVHPWFVEAYQQLARQMDNV
jgi:predicted HD superfamily hydrolase involved in NAD metabolism